MGRQVLAAVEAAEAALYGEPSTGRKDCAPALANGSCDTSRNDAYCAMLLLLACAPCFDTIATAT